jgi:hypothetical protein
VAHSEPTATQRRRSEVKCRNGESTSNCALETAGESSLTDTTTAKVNQKNSELDKCLRSRSAFAARGEDVAVATSNIAAQGTSSELELEQNVKNVEIVDNSKVASNKVENLNLANQLQSMFNTFRISMQKDIAKLTSNLETEFNKLSEDLDAKFAAISERLDKKLNLFTNRVDVKLNTAIAILTAEVREQNEQMRQEFSIQLETKIQGITREVELVKRGTNKELSICM